MRILHTADWHIGKKYKNTEFLKDFQFAFNQILSIIQSEQVDVLLVSGDVFDKPSPTHDAQNVYFDSLLKLANTNLSHIIITSGNHDSTSFLDAPKELLNHLNITIIGRALDPKDSWISIQKDSDIVHIAAVPFLRNSDFPSISLSSGLSIKERNLEGLKQYYQSAWEHKPSQKGTYIAMGHFTAGRTINHSESEDEILIGTLDMATADQFPVFNYFALGHIHKPQTVSASANMYYSGSPYPMSFTEKEDQKRVLILDTKQENTIPESFPLENLRSFKRISGSVDQVKQALNSMISSQTKDTFIDVNFETGTSPYSKVELQQIIQDFNKELESSQKEIFISSFSINKPIISALPEDIVLPDADLDSITPQQVLESILNKLDFSQDQKSALIEEFLTISIPN